MATTFEGILSDLKKKQYSTVYFLQGEEPYFIDKISQYIEENVLTPDQKVFNQSVVYGKDITVANLDTMAKRFPMMSDYQVVIVKEAQELKKIEDLMFYVQKPQKQTILVLCHKYKTLDKRKKLYSLLEKNAVMFTSEKLRENKVPDWINGYVKEKELAIDQNASRMIAEYLGTDLSKIANAIDKLAIVLKKGSTITPENVQTNIGISKDYNNFELQNAIITLNQLKAARIVNHFAANQKENPLVLTITSLYGFFVKLLIYWQYKSKDPKTQAAAMGVNPYFIKDYDLASKKFGFKKTLDTILLLHQYDLKSKGVNNVSTEPGELLKELVYKIMH